MALRCCLLPVLSFTGKEKLFADDFAKKSYLNDSIISFPFPYDGRSVSNVSQPSPFFPELYLIFQFLIIKNGTNKKSVGKLVKR